MDLLDCPPVPTADDGLRARQHTGKLVKFQGEGYREEEQLVANCNEESNGEVVIVKGIDFSHDCGRSRPLSTEVLMVRENLFSPSVVLDGVEAHIYFLQQI
jgi:hypothetical protein